MLSVQLMRYWRDQLARPPGARRIALDATCARVRAQGAPASALQPFVLGDTDENIVFCATAAYLASSKSAVEPAPQVAGIAAGWIRRRMALNCPAVFAGLLATADEWVLELLLPLRQTLEEGELDAVWRLQGDSPAAPVRAFVAEWRSLLNHSGDRSQAAPHSHLPPR